MIDFMYACDEFLFNFITVPVVFIVFGFYMIFALLVTIGDHR